MQAGVIFMGMDTICHANFHCQHVAKFARLGVDQSIKIPIPLPTAQHT